MKGRVSRATQRSYPLTMICAVYRIARSSVYATIRPTPAPRPATNRGPRRATADAEIVEAILAACPFHGEGYRKVRARLAIAGCTSGASGSCGSCAPTGSWRPGGWDRRMATRLMTAPSSRSVRT